jgi:hypothetical protein
MSLFVKGNNNKPVEITIYGHKFEFQDFYVDNKINTLKEYQEKDVTPYHFLAQKNYYTNYNCCTIEDDNFKPYGKYLYKNLIIELYEFFKNIAPKERLIKYLFYLFDKRVDFPFIEPDIISICDFREFNLDIIKKYKKFDKDEINKILLSNNCNLEICEYLEKTFNITQIPTNKTEANTYLGYFIKNKFITGINTLATKFKIDTTKIITKSITSKNYDILFVLFKTISKVQREKYYDQLIKLMPKLIGDKNLTTDFIKLIEDIKPIEWKQYNRFPDDGFRNYLISNTSILGHVTYDTKVDIIDYIAPKLTPKMITDVYYSHTRSYSLYSLFEHTWDRNDKQSIKILKKLIEAYENALENSAESTEDSSSESSGESEEENVD